MAEKLLFRFELNDELKKIAEIGGEPTVYEVRERPHTKDTVSVWWDEDDGERYGIYKTRDVKEKLELGFWIKLD